MRGQKSENGATRVAPNGYHYTKVDGVWVLTHRLVWEKANGRKIRDNERVRFKDGDRTNYENADNIEVYQIKDKSPQSRRAIIEAKIAELQAELRELEDA
jgi:hypothetical protein